MEKWLKPAKGAVLTYYAPVPDFAVETKATRYLCERKTQEVPADFRTTRSMNQSPWPAWRPPGSFAQIRTESRV